ncbi:MAG: hypothetical protein AB2L09_08230 [Coriobacteriia bacterium]
MAPAASLVFAWLYFFGWNSIGLVVALGVLKANPEDLRVWGSIIVTVFLPYAMRAAISWSAIASDFLAALAFPVLIHAAFKWSRGDGPPGSTRRVGWFLAAWVGASLIAVAMTITSDSISLFGGVFSFIARAIVIIVYLIGWLVFGAEAVADKLLETRSRPVRAFARIGAVVLLETVGLFVFLIGGFFGAL